MSLASASDPISTVLGAVDGANAVPLTQEIVRIPSVVGEEGELARALAARMEDMGYDRVYLQDVLPDRPNVVGVVDSGRPGPTLVLTGHIDTKPVCLGWDDDPYSGRLAGGQLHGHAVMDMKAGVGPSSRRAQPWLEPRIGGEGRCSWPLSRTTWVTSRARSSSSRSTRGTSASWPS